LRCVVAALSRLSALAIQEDIYGTVQATLPETLAAMLECAFVVERCARPVAAAGATPPRATALMRACRAGAAVRLLARR